MIANKSNNNRLKLKDMKTFETYLPIFTGFYETIFNSDCAENMEMEYINEQREENNLPPLDWNDLDFNYKEYEEKVARECVNSIEYELRTEVHDTIEIKFQKIVSPREYNFTNDSINIEISLDEEARKKIIKLLTKNIGQFVEYIADRYTSCDGFISSHSNKAEDWIRDLQTWEDNWETKLSHKIGAVLDFILTEIVGFDRYDLHSSIDHCTYHIEVNNYDELLTKIKED